MNKKPYIFVCAILAILVLVGVIVFALSVSTVKLNHIAIMQNKFNKKIDEATIYKNGRYLIGPTNK